MGVGDLDNSVDVLSLTSETTSCQLLTKKIWNRNVSTLNYGIDQVNNILYFLNCLAERCKKLKDKWKVSTSNIIATVSTNGLGDDLVAQGRVLLHKSFEIREPIKL